MPTRLPLGLVLSLLAAPVPGQTTFVDRSDAAGIVLLSYSRGSAWVDLDRDGRLDLAVGESFLEDSIYRQLPDATFVRINATWGPAPSTDQTWGVLAADFDNDGDDDLYYLNGGFVSAEPNRIVRNDLAATGLLVDATATSGLGGGDVRTFGGTTLDYDRDGELDVFVSNLHGVSCRLFRNKGGLAFEDVSAQAGIVEPGSYRHCSTGDIDLDGWIDVGVGEGSFGANLLYHNQADGTFRNIATSAGVASPQRNFGLVLEDYDNDGWVDVFLPKNVQSSTAPIQSMFFMNNGDLTFTDVTAGSGTTSQTDMGHNSGDLDADGYPDVLIGTGAPLFADFDVLYYVVPDGVGGVTVTSGAAASGLLVNGPTRGHGMPFGDYDEDGDLDVFCANGGPSHYPDTWEYSYLWQNQGNGNGWLALDLVGVVSNRTAVGTRSVARTSAGREVHRYLSVGKGFGNTDAHTQHFGLGGDAAVDEVEVTWPSGITQVVLSPPLGSRAKVVESGLLVETEPKLGGVLAILGVGQAGHVCDLWGALGTASVPLPEFGGIVGLAPPLFALGKATLGADGTASLIVPVPHEPALQGWTVYAQAWIREPGAVSGGLLSNVVAATIQ